MMASDSKASIVNHRWSARVTLKYERSYRERVEEGQRWQKPTLFRKQSHQRWFNPLSSVAKREGSHEKFCKTFRVGWAMCRACRGMSLKMAKTSGHISLHSANAVEISLNSSITPNLFAFLRASFACMKDKGVDSCLCEPLAKHGCGTTLRLQGAGTFRKSVFSIRHSNYIARLPK